MRLKNTSIKAYQVIVYVTMFLLMSFLYHTTLWLNRAGYNDNNDSLFDWWSWFNSGGLQYILMLIASGAIWYEVFVVCQQWKLHYRLLLHILGLPFFVLIAQQLYYWICDLLSLRHLTGSGAIWDIYIPSLLYLILFSLLHAYEYYGIIQQKLRNEIELKNIALKSELSAIKAQLNPHFLYNVFNTINASLPPKSEKTRDMIAQLADLFRYQLQATRHDLVTLREELDFVKKYLELEKARFEDRLEIILNVPEEFLDEKVPPMLLQPIVENSLKHGISELIDGGSISIIVKKIDGKLIFEIADTGVGIKDKSAIFGRGVGLTNTQLRLLKMYNSPMEILDNVPKGLLVRFAI